ncbi:Uncharacterised protein [uncultured archaeon]|nr:Uncharacterised protein [uncultured archaeon]
MLGRKKSEGRPLPETADMKIWREEFNQMSLEDHDRVLKNLGLDDEDVEEFNAATKGGKKLEDLMGVSESEGGQGEGTEIADSEADGAEEAGSEESARDPKPTLKAKKRKK